LVFGLEKKISHQSKKRTRSQNLASRWRFRKTFFKIGFAINNVQGKRKYKKFVLKQFAFILFDTSEVFQISQINIKTKRKCEENENFTLNILSMYGSVINSIKYNVLFDPFRLTWVLRPQNIIYISFWARVSSLISF
jgi:hypothetical protein